jgi:lambda repressor-like predicted transcriptional regulator
MEPARKGLGVNRELIQAMLAQKGISLAQAAAKMGRSPSYLQQFLRRGVPRELNKEQVEVLSFLTGIPPQDLTGPDLEHPTLPKTRVPIPVELRSKNKATGRGNDLDNALQQSVQSLGPRDLPVFGATRGDQGVLRLTNEAVDWVARPSSLERVLGAYGVIVVDDVMSPKFELGSTVCFHPHLPPRPGDAIILRASDTPGQFMIRMLRKYTDTHWHVAQIHPAKESQVKRSEFPTVHVAVANIFSRA